jgi:hypothetical protein
MMIQSVSDTPLSVIRGIYVKYPDMILKYFTVSCNGTTASDLVNE